MDGPSTEAGMEKRLLNDPRPTFELFAETLAGDYDDDRPWDAVRVLRWRGTVEVFEAAAEHCRSDDAKARARGLDVLAQLGAGKPDAERPHLHDSVSLAITRLNDPDPLVVHSAAWALAHLRTPDAIAALIPMRHHEDPSVRHAVAFALMGSGSSEAVHTLLGLMEDANDEVRDWATFSLGQTPGADSPEIRQALRLRLEDPCPAVRCEAIWGLALRKDELGLTLLLQRLESEDCVSGDEMAAQETLDVDSGTPPTELCAALRNLLAP
jgi:HEAT repeat protein